MDYGEVNAATKPPTGRRMKFRAPPPPLAPEPAPRSIFRNAVPDGGGQCSAEAGEDDLRASLDIHLTLPHGYHTTSTVDGSKALMDLLVELCSQYHLNPAHHTLELLSAEGQPLAFKPNALLGSQDVARVLIREKVWEEKVVRRPPPRVPEQDRPVKPLRAHAKKTVRLVVNYHQGQKAVLRVNPAVPVRTLLVAICDKCEFDPAHVLLLQDGISQRELPLDQSLNELGIRELYALDQSLDLLHSRTLSTSVTEKKGLLGLFSFNRRKSKGLSTASLVPCVEARPSTLGQSQSVMNISRMSPKTEPKKRRAPPPPAPTPIPGQHFTMDTYQVTPGSPRSESQQRKRKAPAPPPTLASITPSLDSPATPTLVPSSPASPVTPTPTPAPSSPASSSTAASLLAQDSSSALSHSTSDDSEADGSMRSTSSCSSVAVAEAVAEAGAMAGGVAAATTTASCTSSSMADQTNPAPISLSEDEPSTLNLKVEEVENNRHSTIGAEQPVPLKPLRSSVLEYPQPCLPPSPSPPLPPSESSPDTPLEEEVLPQSWIYSGCSVNGESPDRERAVNGESPDRERAVIGQSPDRERAVIGQSPDREREQTFWAVSSDGGQFQNQGSAASECVASSTSDIIHPTSPGSSLSLEISGHAPPLAMSADGSSTTWASRHRSSSDIIHQRNTGRFKDAYEEDLELTDQQHQPPADLAADTSQVNAFSLQETTYFLSESSQVPVSVVDMDVPVTTIDEVLEDCGQSMTDYEAALPRTTQQTVTREPSSSCQSGAVIENRNNNACSSESHNQASSVRPPPLLDADCFKIPGGNTSPKPNPNPNPNTKASSTEKEKQKALVTKTEMELQREKETSDTKHTTVHSNSAPNHLPSGHSESDEDVDGVPIYRGHVSISKITHNPMSRFGMKTFTVVPPKPAVALAQKPATNLTAGAIKIDDQGNMVKVGIQRNKFGGSSESGINTKSYLLEKAKAFWSSTEKQEASVTSRGPSAKAVETEVLKTPAISAPEHAEKAKPVEPAKDVMKTAEKCVDADIMVSASEPNQHSVKHHLVSSDKRDLSFLRPSRRTSSQYVASTITKYTATPQVKASSFHNIPESLVPGGVSCQKVGRSIQVAPHQSNQLHQSVTGSVSGKQERGSIGLQSLPEGPKRSTIYPDCSSERQAVSRELKQDWRGSVTVTALSAGGGSSKSLESVTVTAKTGQPGSPTVKPKQKIIPNCSTKQNGHPMASQNIEETSTTTPSCPALAMETSTTISTATCPAVAKETSTTTATSTCPALETSTTITTTTTTSTSPALAKETSTKTSTCPTLETFTTTTISTCSALAKNHSPLTEIQVPGGLVPDPQQAGMFGPVKKFKPVVLKSVQKETSVHSTLMEAIQSGGGKERLRKISDSCASMEKKPCFAEEENERSALLAAIRAQSNGGRLRTTNSEAAEELVKLRKTEVEGHSPFDTRRPSPPTSRPFSIPPSPPPPPSCQPKPSMVVGSGEDPALARQAVLEAIRSGCPAKGLKKVTAPTNTVQVNGKLGTIHATSSYSQGQ